MTEHNVILSGIRYNRPSRDQIYLQMADVLMQRSTCKRRQVGCILVDINNRIVATGYNGVPSNWEHCIDTPCPGADCQSGTSLDKCQAIHAEQNALLQCSIVEVIATAYCTSSPCIHCVKLLLNTNCHRIVFRQEYTHNSKARELWLNDPESREWIHLP